MALHVSHQSYEGMGKEVKKWTQRPKNPYSEMNNMEIPPVMQRGVGEKIPEMDFMTENIELKDRMIDF